MASPDAAIESVIVGSKGILSFRKLSTMLEIPLRTAQAHLHAYSQTARNILILSQAPSTDSDVPRTRLVVDTAPPPAAHLIWALGPDSAPDTPAVWLQVDRDDALAASQQAPDVTNFVRHSRYLPVVSASAAWDARPDPRFGNGPPPSATPRKPSSLLAAVKASSKAARSAKGKPTSQQKQMPQKPASQKPPSSTSSIPKPPSSAGTSSLFSSKRLGQTASARINASQRDDTRPAKSSSTDKKRRASSAGKKKVPVIEDDKEDESDENDDADSLVQMERRAMEREVTEEERAEVERELQELNREADDDDDDPESPTLKDVDDDDVVKDELDADDAPPDSPPEKTGTKRSFHESFGLPKQTTGPRRIRKEVDEVVEEDGYMVTRRVVKTFDENGNEVEDDRDIQEVALSAEDSGRKTKLSPEADNNGKVGNSLKPKNASFKSSTGKSDGKSNGKSKKNGLSSKSTNSKPGSSTNKKSKKKVKGNIMSYFKKT